MSANTIDGLNYIIFLKLSDRLPFWYGRLAREMKEFDLTLIPMGLGDLKELSLKSRVHVLCFNDSPATHRTLASFRSRYLDFAMTRKKLVLYELSSFAPISKKFTFNSQEHYRHLCLPLSLKSVIRFVAGDYYFNWESDALWPGGKRATLPDQGQSR